MAPTQFKVIIAGGGIVGLSLGVMLERAGTDYLILDAADEIRPLGGVLYLGAPVLRSFEQLGLLDDLIRQSNVMTGATLMDHNLNKICRLSTDFARERYTAQHLHISPFPLIPQVHLFLPLQESSCMDGLVEDKNNTGRRVLWYPTDPKPWEVCCTICTPMCKERLGQNMERSCVAQSPIVPPPSPPGSFPPSAWR